MDTLTREVDEAPSGAAVGAFFDLDGTLVDAFSADALAVEVALLGWSRPLRLAAVAAASLGFRVGQVRYVAFVGALAALLRGLPEQALAAAGERAFTRRLRAAVYPQAAALVTAHAARGHTLAVVSSATRYQVEPVARALGISHVLCTRLAVADGRFTGELAGAPCWRAGKVAAARAFAGRTGVDLASSWFYTDHEVDLPLLDAVGHPRPTNASPGLAAIARERGWPVRRLAPDGTAR